MILVLILNFAFVFFAVCLFLPVLAVHKITSKIACAKGRNLSAHIGGAPAATSCDPDFR